MTENANVRHQNNWNQSYKDEMKRILESKDIYSVFQPIVSLRDGSILGYEALSRIQGEYSMPNIGVLFDEAVKAGEVWSLEQLARKKAFEAISMQTVDSFQKKLFINVSPHIIYDGKFRAGFTRELLKNYQLSPEQITFEITENERVSDNEGFLKIIDHYKNGEYQIAIDDAGSGYSGLNLICDVKPHFIKLDMRLVRDIHKSSIQYAVVKSMVELGNLANIKIIAEGVETYDELEALITLGVHYGQGYHIGYPSLRMREIKSDVKAEIRELNIRKHSAGAHGSDSYYIRNIAANGITVYPEMVADEVMRYMEKNIKMPGICVLEGEKVVGIITREKLLKSMGGRYGYSLYKDKHVSKIMERHFLQVDGYTPINSVASMAMERETRDLYDFIVVTDNERYLGIVTIKDLLKKATEIDVNTARSANPLTGLPGNMQIEREIEAAIKNGGEYTVLYLDLDNFKAYNDVYGFEKGDMIIKLLADVIRKNVDKRNFIGHIGGDDFVVIIYENITEGFVKKISRQFESEAKKYYNKNDRNRGYIIAGNRNGETEKYPLVGVTIVAVSGDDYNFFCGCEVSEELSRLKKIEKKKKTEDRIQRKKIRCLPVINTDGLYFNDECIAE